MLRFSVNQIRSLMIVMSRYIALLKECAAHLLLCAINIAPLAGRFTSFRNRSDDGASAAHPRTYE